MDNDLPVLSCTQFNSGGGYRYARFSQPLQLNDVLCDFPDLKMVLLHAGHAKLDWFEESILVAMNNPNVYIQIDVWVQGTGIPRDPRTSLFPLNAFNAEETIVTMLARAKYALGAHRILFGTDTESGPAFQGDNSVRGFGYKNLIDWWRKLPQTAAKYGFSFTDEEIGMILDTNAKRLFKLEATPPDLEVRGKYDSLVKTRFEEVGHSSDLAHLRATVCWGSVRNRDCILYPGVGTFVLIRPTQTFYERIKYGFRYRYPSPNRG